MKLDKIDIVIKLIENIEKQQDELRNEVKDIKFEIRDMKQDQREDRKMLMDIWKTREKVTARVTWDFVLKATTFNAILLVFMLFMLKTV